MSTTLLIIRHGRIRANRVQRWHGATDSPLTGAGRRQTLRLARELEREPLDGIYSSPLRRCYDTASAIAAATGGAIAIDDDLREYTIGTLENSSYRRLQREHDFFRRILSEPDFAPAGGESLSRVAERSVAALERIATRHEGGGRIAVVSHGAAMAVALAQLFDDDATRWMRYSIANCSITELVLRPRPRLDAFNRIDHL